MVIDMAKTPLQLRGHCQRCGNQQAVRNGRIAHHGYVVRNGWFQGACSGYQYAPIEYSRTTLDKTVEIIRDQITNLRESASLLSSPAWWPKEVLVYNRVLRKDELVPLASLSEVRAKEIIRARINGDLSRARAGEEHIAYLLEVAALYHGKDLIEVERDAAPEAILPGDQRLLPTKGLIDPSNPQVATCRRVEGGRVYYINGDLNQNGKRVLYKTTTRAWRNWAKAS